MPFNCQEQMLLEKISLININIRVFQADEFIQRNQMDFIKPKDKLILMLWNKFTLIR